MHFSADERAQRIGELVPRVKQIARQLARRLPSRIDVDDLISAGMVGLVEAVDRFDPTKCGSVQHYAEIRIRGSMLDELRSLDWASRSLRRQVSAVQSAVTRLTHALGRTPEPQEVAEDMGLELEEYHQLMRRIRPVLVMSFEDIMPFRDDDRRDAIQYFNDPKAVDPAAVLQHKRLLDVVQRYLKYLPERDRVVVKLYHFQGMKLKQIGKILGVTESRISQILSKTVAELRRKIREDLDQDGPQLED